MESLLRADTACTVQTSVVLGQEGETDGGRETPRSEPRHNQSRLCAPRQENVMGRDMICADAVRALRTQGLDVRMWRRIPWLS